MKHKKGRRAYSARELRAQAWVESTGYKPISSQTATKPNGAVTASGSGRGQQEAVRVFAQRKVIIIPQVLKGAIDKAEGLCEEGKFQYVLLSPKVVLFPGRGGIIPRHRRSSIQEAHETSNNVLKNLPGTLEGLLGEAAIFGAKKPEDSGKRFVGFRLGYELGRKASGERTTIGRAFGIGSSDLASFAPRIEVGMTYDYDEATSFVNELNTGQQEESVLLLGEVKPLFKPD